MDPIAMLSLAQLLSSCAPNIGVRTMTAVIRVESGGSPLAMHDNTLRRSFAPRDLNEGVAWANQLLARHHSLDLGLSQVNSANLTYLGMSVREAFDPCTNVHGGATILASDYRRASSRFGAGQLALRRALGAYNTGSLFAGDGYIDEILQAASIVDTDIAVPDLQPAASSSPSRSERAPVAIRPAPVALPSRKAAPTASLIDPYHAPILTGQITAGTVPAATPRPVVLAPVRLTNSQTISNARALPTGNIPSNIDSSKE